MGNNEDTENWWKSCIGEWYADTWCSAKLKGSMNTDHYHVIRGVVIKD